MERVNRFIQDIRNIVQLELDRMGFRYEVSLVSDVVQTVLKTLNARFEAKNQQVILNLPDFLPLHIDSYHLEQLLGIFLENASFYTPSDGHISLSVELLRESEIEFLRFIIRDDGIGIDAKEHKHIFMLWSRSEDSRVREVAGMGASLYIAKMMVEAMGGQIGFESELDKGSTFYFTVPIATE